jgi:hypothetical protein
MTGRPIKPAAIPAFSAPQSPPHSLNPSPTAIMKPTTAPEIAPTVWNSLRLLDATTSQTESRDSHIGALLRSAGKKPCASRHRRSSHTLTEAMPIRRKISSPQRLRSGEWQARRQLY